MHSTNNTSGTSTKMLISPTAKYILIVSYTTIFVIGSTGNLAVIYILGIKRRMAKTVDVQIVALAVADALSAIFSPLVSVYDLTVDWSEWKLLGDLGCKLFVSMDHVTMLVSAFMLVMISVERLRVIGSVTTIKHRRNETYFGILVVWLSAISIVSPYMHSLTLSEGKCMPEWDSVQSFTYYAVYTNLSCFVPALIMVIVYTTSIYKLLQGGIPGDNNRVLNEKRRAQYKRITKMFGTIALMYFLLTTPNMVVHFASSYYGTFHLTTYKQHMKLLVSLTYIFYTLSHCNCAVNPFIYAKMYTNVMKSVSRANTYFTRTVHIVRRQTTRNPILLRRRKAECIRFVAESKT